MNAYEINLNIQGISGANYQTTIDADECDFTDDEGDFVVFWKNDDDEEPVAIFKRDLVISIIKKKWPIAG